jgi:hypothetical protein
MCSTQRSVKSAVMRISAMHNGSNSLNGLNDLNGLLI